MHQPWLSTVLQKLKSGDTLRITFFWYVTVLSDLFDMDKLDIADNNVDPSEPGISIHGQVATKSMPLPSAVSELKAIILTEISHVHGFMQLLMKPRNGMPWSQEDRSAILQHLKHLARSLPILVIFTFPGGSLLLPLLAWFLDRRKNRQKLTVIPTTVQETSESATLVDSATQRTSETAK